VRLYRPCFALAFAAIPLFAAPDARAQDPVPVQASSVAPAGVAPKGFVVVGAGVPAAEAFRFAQVAYKSASLRPARLTESQARVLVGEAPSSPDDKALTELAQLRDGVHGDDAASRSVLGELCRQLGVEGVAVVSPIEGQGTVVRLFLASSGFDAAVYHPAPAPGDEAWAQVVRSLERNRAGLGGAPAPAPMMANPDALKASPKIADPGGSSKPFYKSPWFWGAIGGAAFLGGGVFLATRETDASTVRLQMRVPQ